MCTVTYQPLSSGFILTSNRDEQVTRQSLLPRTYINKGINLTYPKDTWKEGSWIAVSALQKRAACLLNGAFEPHTRRESYKLSRGHILLDSFVFPNEVLLNTLLDTEGIEPFTMILLNWKNELNLYEFRWDGVQKHFMQLDHTSPSIWSSSTLYDKREQYRREKLLSQQDWFNSAQPETDIINFHEQHFYQHYISENQSYKLDLQTISISQLRQKHETTGLLYKDLITNSEYKLTL